MRMVRALFCAAAIAALLSPAVRADEWTKLTYFTFSAPVQVPGVTLPAGTYMFKLADPETGRKAIQIMDKEGTKVYTILLSQPDTQMELKDDPWVSFIERPSGEPAAIRSWFYPGERTGYEFIYPRDEAMRLARESNTEVLAHVDDMKPGADITAMRGAKVERLRGSDERVDLGPSPGAAPPTSAAPTTAASATANSASAVSTTTADAASTVSTTTANAATSVSTTTADSARAASMTTADAARTAATTTATSPSATTSASMNSQSPAATAVPSGNRTEPPAAVGTAGQTAPMSGQPARELPRTASDLGFIQLLSGLSLVSAAAIRQRRKRLAAHRA